MTPRAAASTCAGVLALIVSAGAQQPLFRGGVSLVRVDVLATDDGRPIPDLTQGDFEIHDNGLLQQVDSVVGDTEPIDVLFTFDRSASTRGETLTRLRESASALLDALDTDDSAGLLTFNHTFRLAVPIGPVPDVRNALRAIEPDGSTAILDATAVALALTAANSRRTLVLVFTDGVDTLSWLPEGTVLEAARGSEAVLYAVTVPDNPRLARPLAADDAQLRRLAEATGGRLLRASNPSQLRDRFMETLREMRARYVLTYTPRDTAAGWHALTVRLKNRRGRIASRAGYVVPAGEPR
jgi:VWFA-related protein